MARSTAVHEEMDRIYFICEVFLIPSEENMQSIIYESHSAVYIRVSRG